MRTRSLALLVLCGATACGSVQANPPDAEVTAPDATVASCGDGVIVAPETCDDGAAVAGDGCSDTCQVERYARCTGAPSTCHHVNILYAPTNPDDAAFRGVIAGFTGGTVAYYAATGGTPALADLAPYDCLYTWVSTGYADNVAFGDLMADFADAGNVSVLGGFTSYTQGSFLSGRIMTDGYSPVANPTGGNHLTTAAYAHDGTTLLHESVAAYSSQYRDTLVVQGAGLVDGHYDDGEIAQAYRPDFHVVYSNGVGDAGDPSATGDWARVIANACAAAFRGGQ